jgi:hypothetical protein
MLRLGRAWEESAMTPHELRATLDRLDLSAAEAGHLLGVHRATIYRWLDGSMSVPIVVDAVTNGEVKVERVVIACDCGTVVNPRGVENQLEGGAEDGSLHLAHARQAMGRRRRARRDHDSTRGDQCNLRRHRQAPALAADPRAGFERGGVSHSAQLVVHRVGLRPAR